MHRHNSNFDGFGPAKPHCGMLILAAREISTAFITYPLGGGYVLFSPLFLTALSLSLSLSLLSVISYLLFGITRPLLERE